jgi:hypothetical protein
LIQFVCTANSQFQLLGNCKRFNCCRPLQSISSDNNGCGGQVTALSRSRTWYFIFDLNVSDTGRDWRSIPIKSFLVSPIRTARIEKASNISFFSSANGVRCVVDFQTLGSSLTEDRQRCHVASYGSGQADQSHNQ